MESLNQFKPKLTNCEITSDVNWVCLESRDHDKQVLLPNDCQSLLKWMDGAHTVEQIVSREFDEKARLSLKNLIHALTRLNDEGFLIQKIPEGILQKTGNGSQIIREKKSFFFRPVFSLTLGQSLILGDRGFESLAVLVLFVQMLLGGFAVLQLAQRAEGFIFSSFLFDADSGYTFSLVKLFLMGSIFLNFKYFVKGFVQLLGHGELGRVELRIYPLGFCLAPSDFVVNRKGSSFFKKIYFISSLFSFLSLVGVLHFFAIKGLNENDFVILGVLLSFLCAHPLHRSDFTDLLERFLPPQRLRHFIPYFRGKALLALFRRGAPIEGENELVVFASLAFVWFLGFTYFLVKYLSQALPNLLGSMDPSTAPLALFSALIIFCFMISLFFSLLKDLSVIFITHTEDNFRKPLSGFFNFFSTRKLGTGDKNEITNVLLTHWLFDGFFPEWIATLLSSSEIRTYKAGSPIIVQGSRGDEVFFLLGGNVKVVLAENSGLELQLAWLSSGAVFGESALLDGAKRAAHVRAVDDSEVLVIPISSFVKLFADSSDSKKILERVALGQYLASSRIFSKLPQDALMNLSSEGVFEKMPKGSLLTKQNSSDRDLYLILRGEADVEVDGKFINRLKQGNFFGEISLLTQSPRTASVIASTDVVVFKLSPESFFKIVSRNPELGVEIENVAEERKDQLQWST